MDIERLIVKTLIPVLLALFCAAPAAARNISNHDIQLAVENEFKHDAGVSYHLVDVRVHDGIVTLEGSVDNILAKERAAEVARTVKGVKSIVNRLIVRPVLRTDDMIKQDVNWALLYDPTTESYEIQVMVKDGRVILDGTVDSWQERNLAATVARGVLGVKDLENRIKVDYKTRRSDLEIAADVRSRLQWDIWVHSPSLKVKVKNGKVILSGKVGSAAERSRAHRIAWVTGVKAVDSGKLEVDWLLAEAMRRKEEHPVRSDKEIKQAVKSAFLYDPRVFSFNPDIRVNAGVVTLTGVVTSPIAKQAAEQDASNTVGVWRVRNHLKVRPVKPVSDENIRENVDKALAGDPYLDRREISVGARNSKVYLYGEVDSPFEKTRAGVLASKVKGVVDVDNFLTVKSLVSWRSFKTDWAIRQDIHDELWWSPFVDADQVHVSVRDGVATLTGTVDSYTERGAAIENAYEGGAREVKNHLKVENDYR